ncbi:MAG: GNAT family N-acetyltransferase, partial [Firmicutes bacterium]|nr:GNAT family N-acetyltransferase [Bacillota bacterium]
MRTLETERLILTKWTTSKEDIEGLYEFAKNPEVGPNAGWKPHADLAESEMIIKEIFMPYDVWCIREKESGRVVGNIGLEPDRRREDVNSRELGYSLAQDCWGKGYMTEAANAVIDYAFEDLELVVMGICTGPDNKRSQRVIEKCGFKFEGVQRRG